MGLSPTQKGMYRPDIERSKMPGTARSGTTATADAQVEGRFVVYHVKHHAFIVAIEIDREIRLQRITKVFHLFIQP
jgi:hypothetical protein